MKKYFIFALAALTLTFAACGDKGNNPEPPASTDPEGDINGNNPEPPAITAPEGAINGLFTINDRGKQVFFSKGNLQATYDGSSWTWSFAEHQWDCIGNQVANTAISGNGKVSTNGTVDLFGWSTASTYYGINNSTNNDNYSGDFVDWSWNPISNGGNSPYRWRTLKLKEWVYLFYGRTDAAKLFSLGKVNGVNGTILLPDNWSGEKFNNAAKGLTDKGEYYNNSNGTNFTFHTYDGDAWDAMEKKGAVFLPAAGYRHGTGVGFVGSNGCYWSASSADDMLFACYLYFYSNRLDPQHRYNRFLGQSVRLVR